MTIPVRLDPKSAEAMKQSPSALGITIVGRGQRCRVAREMKELLSRNILVKLTGETVVLSKS
jgi:hypothetical protein